MHQLAVAAMSLLGLKVWLDIVQYAYYRERMRVCASAFREGAGLLRHAIDRGLLSSDWSLLQTNYDVAMAHARRRAAA